MAWNAPKPLVYVAAPLSNGDSGATISQCHENVHRAMSVFNDLLASPVVPICPHWSVYQNIWQPRDYETWLQYDGQLIRRCDAVYRLPGASAGADRETAFAQSLGIPVFDERRNLLTWASAWSPPLPSKSPSSGPPVIIGLMGPPGAGKTTVAKALCRFFNEQKNVLAVCASFAEPIRRALKAMGVEKNGTDDVLYRTGGQALSAMRKADPDFYVKKMQECIAGTKPLLGYKPVFIIDDVRFENELALCAHLFFLDVYNWDLPQLAPEQANHESEALAQQLIRAFQAATSWTPRMDAAQGRLSDRQLDGFFYENEHMVAGKKITHLLVGKGSVDAAASYIFEQVRPLL